MNSKGRFIQDSKFVVIALAVVFLLPAGACNGLSSHKRYQLKGLIVDKNAETNEITVDHEDIPGFMAAMTMPYEVRDVAGFQQVQVGDQITADVIVENPGQYWLQNLKIIDSSKRGQIPAASEAQGVQPGAELPDLPLINQDGKTIHLSQFRGKAVLATFIYTRCPLPNYCPLISSHFATIHRDLEKQPDKYAKTHLLSISFDPAYDTPAVLRKYGLAYLDDPAGFKQWDFAAPKPGDLSKLAKGFGLYYLQNGNQIAHSMDTVLIGPDGRVKQSWTDNQWQVQEVLAALVSSAVPSKPKDERDVRASR
jgi:protein SCO1